MVEHSKSKSTKPSLRGHGTPCSRHSAGIKQASSCPIHAGKFRADFTQPLQSPHCTYPGRHAVRGGGAEVDVEHPDGDQDGEGDEDHGEEEVLACNHTHINCLSVFIQPADTSTVLFVQQKLTFEG